MRLFQTQGPHIQCSVHYFVIYFFEFGVYAMNNLRASLQSSDSVKKFASVEVSGLGV